MENSEKLLIIDEIEVEYQKLFNECKPKHEKVKAGLDSGLNTLAQLKESSLDKLDENIKESIDKLISPILLIGQNKVKRIYVTSLIVLYKIISNNLINKEQSDAIIKCLEQICEDSNEEFIQQKIIEALIPLIDINIIEIKKDIIESIFKISLKIFETKGTSFKDSLNLLINNLINIISDNIINELNPIIKEKMDNLKTFEIIEKENKNNEIDTNEISNEKNNGANNDNNIENIQEIKVEDEEKKENEKLKVNNYFIEPKFNLEAYEEIEIYKSIFYIFNIACDLSEGKKIEKVYKSIYTKCLGYEILSFLIKKTKSLFIYFPSIISRINESLHQELLKRFGKAYDYFTCIKITKLAVTIIKNLQVGYEYIPFLIKYSENANIGWQKQIGIEALGELISDKDFLGDLFLKNTSLYENIFDCLFKISNEIIDYCKKKNIVMNLKKNELDFEKIVSERIILKEEIIFSYEKEPKSEIVHEIIYVEILQCYISLFKSFENICNNEDIAKEKKTNSIEYQNIIKILGYKEKELLNIIINLCQYSEEDEVIDKFMNILVSIIKSLSLINLTEIRNLYLEEIEKLLGYGTNTFKYNQEINMSLEFEDKIMNIIFRIFNEIPEVLDKEGYTLLISCLHKIYLKILKSDYNLLINPNEEYEINIYIRLFEENIKKYSKIKDLPKILEEDKQKDNVNTIIELDEKKENEETTQKDIIKEEEEKEEEKTKKEEKEKSDGGFFGTFKYMLGLSKKKEINLEEQVIIEKQKKDMYQKLSDNLDNIFLLNSTSFSKESLINIINAFLQNSIEIMEQNKDNQVALLHFNLSKLFEILIVNLNRFNLIWNAFSKIAGDITIRQMKQISHYSIDILTISIIFILNLNIYNLKNNEKIGQISQDKLISSLCEISSKNISQDINLNIIYNISFLLNNAAKLFDTNGWNGFFKTIHNLIIYQDEAQNENCFSIIEKIFDNYLNSISPENISVIMDIIESFISYKKNPIISKDSLEKLDRLSILCEKFQPYIYMTDFNKEEIKLNSIQKSFFLEKYDTKEKRMDYFDTIWKTIFSKLLNLSLDERQEIRLLIINKFSKIFVKRCRSISPKSSLYIIKNNFFENFERIYKIYNGKLKYNKEILELKKEQVLKEKREEKLKREFVIGNLIALDLIKHDEEKENEEIEEKIKENDTEKDKKRLEEMSWEDTLQSCIKSISEIIPAFLETNPNLGYEYYRENIFKLIGDKFKEPMKFISPKIAIEILESIYNISQKNKLLFYKYFEQFLDIYNEMDIFISSDYFFKSFPKLSIEYNMINKVIENIKLVFCNKEFHPIMNNKKIFNTMMNTIKSLIISVHNNEGIKIKKQTEKLLKDEENVFIFINEVQNLILEYNKSNNIYIKKEEDKNIKIDLEEYENEINKEDNENDENEKNENYVDTEDILILYSNFLISYLIIDINNLHSEALCRKVLDQFVLFYTNELLPISIVQKTLPIFIAKCRDLILLRQKSELVATIIRVKEEFELKKVKNEIFNNNNNNFIIDGFLNEPSSSTNYSKEKYINEKKEFIWQYSSEKLIKILTYVIIKNNKEQNYEKYNIEDIWKVIIEAYDMIFRQRESVFKNLKKSHKELLSNSSSEMKISIINFIVNVLLPNSLHIPKEMQIRLLILLDIGSSLENESNNEFSGSVTSSISKVCISNLFELCKFKTPEILKREINVQNFNPDDYVKIKEKIAKMCTPILIKRCKEILKKFLADEIKSGSMPLSRSRLEDIKYVLDKLKKLEIYPDYNKIEEIKGKNKDNKIENEPELTEFILKKKKSHLISLLPLLSEFITTKENEIKILVKDIFKIISSELGIK